MYTDCKNLVDAAKSLTGTLEERNLIIDLAAMREAIYAEQIDLQWVGTKFQLADGLTKRRSDLACSLYKTLILGAYKTTQ